MSTKRTGKGRTRGPVVAVEIGSDWLKVVQASPAKDGVSVSGLHLRKLDSSVSPSEAVATAFKRQKLPTQGVIACLPRQMVNVRMLELPSTDRAEIADMVDLQSGKQTPYSREEIVSDYRIIGSERQGYTRVMLAIVQRSVLRERYFVLEEAGLEVARMCISTEGIFNWYEQTLADDGAALVLDVDSFYSDVLMVYGGAVVFTKSVLQGADQLLNEYEKHKEKFAREVRRSLEICRGELPGLNPNRLVVSGAGPRIDGLADYLGEQLGLAAEVKDCMQAVTSLPDEPSLSEPAYRPVSLTALVGVSLNPEGLAFNLVPDSVRMRKTLVEKARNLTLLAMLVMAVMTSLSVVATLRFFFKKSRLDSLRHELALSGPRAKKVERMREIIKLAKQRQDTRFAAIRLFSEIHRLVPEDVYFDAVSIDTDRGQITLGGSGGGQKEIREFVRELEQSPLFDSAKEEGRTSRDPTTGRWRFQVACSLETET